MEAKDALSRTLQDIFPASISPSPVENCSQCHKIVPKEYVPHMKFSGRPVGVQFTGWVSQLTNGLCPNCAKGSQEKRELELKRENEKQRNNALEKKLVAVLGGERPAFEHTFESFQVTPQNEPAYKVATNFQPGRENVFFWGQPGVGKTHLAHAIVRTMLWRGYTVRYMKTRHLMLNLLSMEADKQLRYLKELAAIQVLILEEFGRGNNSEFTCQCVQDLLDLRDLNYWGGLILLGNPSVEEVAGYWGDPISSRIMQMCKIVKVEGEDMRMRLQATEISRPERPFVDRGPDRRDSETQIETRLPIKPVPI